MEQPVLSAMSREEKLALLEAIEEKKRRLREAKANYKPNIGQLPVHTSPAALRCVFSGNGAGKCLGINTPVLMADGTIKQVQDIGPGEQVMGPDSLSRTVLALGRGQAPMYDVAAVDGSGSSYTCNDEHILSLQYCATDPRYKCTKGQVVNLTVKDYLALPDRQRRLLYGHRTAIAFPDQVVLLDPYWLGIWLGDGHSDGVTFTNEDPVLVDAFCDYALSFGGQIAVRDKFTRADTYRYSNNGNNVPLKFLQHYQLIDNKHIPQCFKINSRRKRLLLLAGILDTDGYLSQRAGRAGYFEIAQRSKTLANDIMFLARSLGFKASSSIKVINGLEYVRMHIKGAIWHIPTRVPHKKAAKRDVEIQRNPLRYKIRVTSLGVGDYYGFSLDGDRLFVLGDCTVTHNTALAANEAISMALGFNPWTGEFTRVPARIVVLLDSPDKVGDLWLPELAKWTTITEDQLHKRGKPYYCRISFKNGSEILFMFHDQNPLLFESIELDYFIADEPPPRHVYVSLRRGARKKGRKPKFLMIGTPITAAWMRTEIAEPWARGELPDTECFTFGTAVNEKNLAEGYIESFSRILSEKEKRIRLHGEFFDLEGLALAHLLDRAVHLVAPFAWDKQFPVVVAIDPHPSKANYALMLGCNREGHLFVLKELRLKQVPREFARSLKKWMDGYRVIDIVCDSLGNSEMSGGEGFRPFIAILNDEGVRARATTYDDKSDEDWIERIKDALALPLEPDLQDQRIPKLRFFSSCPGIVSDIENVQWVKIRNVDDYKPKLDITHKDFLACLKYALASNLTPDKEKTKLYQHKTGAETYGVQKGTAKADPFKRKMRKMIQMRRKKQKREADEDW